MRQELQVSIRRADAMLRLGKLAITALFGVLVFCLVPPSISAGKAIFGKVIEVKGADLVTLDHGAGRQDVRVAGIDVPAAEPYAGAAKQLVANLVLGRSVRMRFISLLPNGEML